MNVVYIKARSAARKLGLIKVVNRLRPARSYEERFHKALVAGIRPGDVVWDIGANEGVYADQFCQWVGESGFVVAFEPDGEACRKMRERVGDRAWFRIEEVALGESDTEAFLVVAAGYSVGNHIKTDKMASINRESEAVPIRLRRGESLWRELGRTPNVIKVDVEGFEGEVLRGFGELLREPKLRGLYIEVHFSELEQRGLADAPVKIERQLKENGFKVDWVDPSHIAATR